jgi:DNA-binding PadR family transcriptional regulator
MPGRVLGLYALSAMDREGRLYGYELAERIAQRTDGSWRPGPGAIYPALEGLAGRGWARSRLEGRRRVYQITPTGRTMLRRVRRQMLWRTRGGPDLGALWSEIAGHTNPGQFRLERMQHHVTSMLEFLARDGATGLGDAALRVKAREVLERAAEQLRGPEAPPVRRPARGRARRA